MLISLLTIWCVRMLDMVISMLVGFPNGARWNLRNAQHRGSCPTLRNVDGDQRCGEQICGVGQAPDPEWRDCLLDLYHDRPHARYGLRTSIQFHWQPCAGGQSCGAESEWWGPQEPCGAPQTAEQTQAAKMKAWNHKVPRKVILSEF